MALKPLLLEILACPEDKGPLYYIEDENILFNPRLARTYEIRDDIPVMLVDEATSLDAEEAQRLQRRVDDEKIAPTGPPA